MIRRLVSLYDTNRLITDGRCGAVRAVEAAAGWARRCGTRGRADSGQWYSGRPEPDQWNSGPWDSRPQDAGSRHAGLQDPAGLEDTGLPAPSLRDPSLPDVLPQDAGPQDIDPLAPDPVRSQPPRSAPARQVHPDANEYSEEEESPLLPWRFH